MDPDYYAAASDPFAAPETLHTIASYYPDLWPAILQNPACYPELRVWIEQQSGYVQLLDRQSMQAQEMQEPTLDAPAYAPSPVEQTSVPSIRKKSKRGVVIAVSGIALVVTLRVGAAATGNMGRVGSALGLEVSREQGCQNLVDALADLVTSPPNLDRFMIDEDYELEDWDQVMGDALDATGYALAYMIGDVSKKIGNREVQAAWDEYGAHLDSFVNADFFSQENFTEENLIWLMSEEARLLNELDVLCPGVVVDESLLNFEGW